MNTIILGKNLLNDAEIIQFAHSLENKHKRNVLELQRMAQDCALISSMAIIHSVQQSVKPINISSPKPPLN